MKAIAVIDKNRALGKGTKLLYDIPSDLQHFKKETLGKTVIMGRTTLGTMPKGKPLPGRNTVVVSRTMTPGMFYKKGNFYAVVAHSKDEALKLFADGIFSDPVVCGGQQIYELFLPECDELVLTEVDAETPDADAFFPDFTGDFEIYEEGPDTTENGLTYRIRRYRRKA